MTPKLPPQTLSARSRLARQTKSRVAEGMPTARAGGAGTSHTRDCPAQRRRQPRSGSTSSQRPNSFFWKSFNDRAASSVGGKVCPSPRAVVWERCQYERRNAIHNCTHGRALTSARNPAGLIVSAPNSLPGPFIFSLSGPFPFYLNEPSAFFGVRKHKSFHFQESDK